MTDRRQFLQIGIAAAAAGSALGSAMAMPQPAPAASRREVPPYKVVYDTRFAACRDFAQTAAALGAATAGIEGDVTGLWFNDLYHRWRQGPAPIAGLTTQASAFCLEQLARDQHMRVVYRGEHQPLPGDRMMHRLSGASRYFFTPGNWPPATAGWAGSVALQTTRCGGGRVRRVRAARFTTPSSASAATTSLVSWVIAPR